MVKFILASQSPRRAQWLKQLSIEFEVIPSYADEDSIPKSNPSSYVKKLAILKAKTVAKKVEEGVIIGADTVIYINGKILGKPKDSEDALSTLRELSGKKHIVFTGICVIDKYSKKTLKKVVKTTVKFRELDDNLIRWYVGTGEPLGKAGSYAVQEKGAILVEWIKGDFYNIVGMPLFTLEKMLEEMKLITR